MKFAINPHNEEPIHLQLREQIIFHISTGELPIGHIMPSLNELARQLKIHRNTVNFVYTELANEGWLVRQRNSRYVVVRRREKPDPVAIENLDDLITRTIRLANERGYSLQQLADRVRQRLLEQPPDHFLIVEPERGMGELMREEIRRKIGHAPALCSLYMLQQNPSLAVGAVLLTPGNLLDGLECIPLKDRHVVSLTYATAEPHYARIQSLCEPSAVGLVSISPAILRTAGGLLASAVGKRHAVHEFLMEWPIGSSGPRFRSFSMKEYHPPAHLRDFQTKSQKLRHEASVTGSDRLNIGAWDMDERAGRVRLLSAGDLKFIDLLFCDTIAYGVVKHRCSVKSQLLSSESLREVASVAEGLPGFGSTARAASSLG